MKDKQCFGCKEKFPKEQLVDYAAPGTKVMHSYCPKCLAEKQEKVRFQEAVCSIFGIKSPGPRIWAERKRLIDKYGYTDGTIIDCLDYIYKVKKAKKLAESLYLVTPTMVEEMMSYKRSQGAVGGPMPQYKKYLVPTEENTKKARQELNPDDYIGS